MQNCLKGKAKDIVKCKLLMSELVPEIIQTLQMYFGRTEFILERAIAKARNMPSPKDKLDTLIDYALCVKNIVATIQTCNLSEHLSNPILVKELMDKLPSQQKLTWATHTCDQNTPELLAFSNWLFSLAEAALKVCTPSFAKTSSSNTHTRVEDASNQSIKLCPLCKQGDHKIPSCELFKSMALNRKLDYIKANKLCR